LRSWIAIVLASSAMFACSSESSDPGSGGTGGTMSSSSGSNVGGDVTNELGKPQFGDPGMLSIQRLAFGPGGVLLMGDGVKDRVVAIETGDTDTDNRGEQHFDHIEGVTNRIATALGDDVPASDIWIQDFALNPLSHRLYVAVTRFTESTPSLLWFGGDGNAHVVDLAAVVYAAINYPVVQSAGSFVTGLAWLDNYIVASAIKQPNTPSNVMVMNAPFNHGGGTHTISPFIYYPGFAQWVSEVAVDGLFPFEHQGSEWVALGFPNCPVVRYRVSDIAGGLGPEGETAFDFGSGTIRDAFHYELDGEKFLLVTVYNLGFLNQTLGVRIQESLLIDEVNINSLAPILFQFDQQPLVAGVDRIYSLDEAEHLLKLGTSELVIFRADSLQTMSLPPNSLDPPPLP
jgi:hypothetical protein